jgi:hypothetical protein
MLLFIQIVAYGIVGFVVIAAIAAVTSFVHYRWYVAMRRRRLLRRAQLRADAIAETERESES